MTYSVHDKEKEKYLKRKEKDLVYNTSAKLLEIFYLYKMLVSYDDIQEKCNSSSYITILKYEEKKCS